MIILFFRNLYRDERFNDLGITCVPALRIGQCQSSPSTSRPGALAALLELPVAMQPGQAFGIGVRSALAGWAVTRAAKVWL